MNNMEDKELQELFDAKRTVEANRRRQEALRQLIEARAAEEAPAKVRKLWPVWTGAAAAAVALLLVSIGLTVMNNESQRPSVSLQTQSPSDEFLGSLTDEEVAQLPYIEIEEIPEY